jgi:hypothetical protein
MKARRCGEGRARSSRLAREAQSTFTADEPKLKTDGGFAEVVQQEPIVASCTTEDAIFPKEGNDSTTTELDY